MTDKAVKLFLSGHEVVVRPLPEVARLRGLLESSPSSRVHLRFDSHHLEAMESLVSRMGARFTWDKRTKLPDGSVLYEGCRLVEEEE